MTHVPGHVVIPPRSPGFLLPCKLESNGELAPQNMIIEFDPENDSSGGEKEIGFHPVMKQGKLFAEDIVSWKDHIAAEAEVIKELKIVGINVSRLEELYNHKDNPAFPEKIGEVRKKLSKNIHKTILDKSVGYIKKQGFVLFYLDETGIRQSNGIVDVLLGN